MGAALGLPNLERMQEQQAAMQRDMLAQQAAMQRTMIERQLQMQIELRERMVAVQVVEACVRFNWVTNALLVVTPILVGCAVHARSPALLIPIVPFGMYREYLYHFAYGNKFNMGGAGRLLKEERSLLAMPGEPLTVELLDKRIEAKQAAARKRIE